MGFWRLRTLSAFALWMILMPTAHAAAGFDTCTTMWNRLHIAVVDRNPFTADVRLTSWQVPVEGAKVQVGVVHIFHVARDSAGRVAIRGPFSYGEPLMPYLPGSPKSVEAGHPAANNWLTVICDSRADTTTMYNSGQNGLHETGPVRVFAMQGGGMDPGLWPVTGFARVPKKRQLKWADLGEQNIEGVPAHGNRYWMDAATDGSTVEAHFTEQWVSDDLRTEVSVVEATRNKEERAELVHIKRVEPDPALFEIPADREVQRKTPGSP